MNRRPGSAIEGTCTYSSQDESFGFVPINTGELEDLTGPDGTASYSIGALEIELSVATGDLLYAWGYLPETTWKQTSLRVPHFSEGRIQAAGRQFARGVSYPLEGQAEWFAEFDRESGWIRYSYSEIPFGNGVLIATSTVVVPKRESIAEVWLHPTFVD
jgi:hypothetical protein